MDESVEGAVAESAEQEEIELLRSIDARLEELIDQGEQSGSNQPVLDALTGIDTTLQTISTTLSTFLADWIAANTPPPNVATSLVLTVQGGQDMPASFTVDTTDGVAILQFTDDHADPVAGPNDSVTAAPIVPVVASDDAAALTAAVAVADATVAGKWTSALTPVAVGAANVSVGALVNSDGSPVNETVGPNAGQPFPVPAPVNVTVGPGAVAALTMTVTG